MDYNCLKFWIFPAIIKRNTSGSNERIAHACTDFGGVQTCSLLPFLFLIFSNAFSGNSSRVSCSSSVHILVWNLLNNSKRKQWRKAKHGSMVSELWWQTQILKNICMQKTVLFPSDVSVFPFSKFDSVFLLRKTELVWRLGIYLAK